MDKISKIVGYVGSGLIVAVILASLVISAGSWLKDVGLVQIRGKSTSTPIVEAQTLEDEEQAILDILAIKHGLDNAGAIEELKIALKDPFLTNYKTIDKINDIAQTYSVDRARLAAIIFDYRLWVETSYD